MNSERLISWSTIATNIAVVIGLLFLVLEIQQNNEFFELERDSRAIDLMIDVSDIQWTDESMSELLALAPSERSLPEKIRFSSFSRTSIARLQRAWNDGYFDTELNLNETYRSIWHREPSLLPGNYLREGWKIHEESDFVGLNPGFVRWFQENVIEFEFGEADRR